MDARSLVNRLQNTTHTALHQNNHAPLRGTLSAIHDSLQHESIEDAREVQIAVVSLAPLFLAKFPSKEGAHLLDGIFGGRGRSEDSFSTLIAALRTKDVIQPQ